MAWRGVVCVTSCLLCQVTILAWFEMAMVAPERIQQYIDVQREGTAEQKVWCHFNRRHIDPISINSLICISGAVRGHSGLRGQAARVRHSDSGGGSGLAE